MELGCCLAVSLVSLFGGGEVAQRFRTAVDADPGLVLLTWLMPCDTLESTGVAAPPAGVADVLLVCGKAKIVPSIMRLIAVEVIDMQIARVLSGHQLPNKAMGLVSLTIHLDSDVALGIKASSHITNLDPVGSAYLPVKTSGDDRVGKELLQTLLRRQRDCCLHQDQPR